MRLGWTGLMVGMVGLSSPVVQAQSERTLSFRALEAQVQAGTRVEVVLAPDGSVRAIQLDDDNHLGAELTDRVVDVGDQYLEVAHLGTIDLARVQRFRGAGGASVARDAWLATLTARISAGRTAWIEAHGTFEGARFRATEVKWDDDGPTELEGRVEGLTGDTLTVAGRTFSLKNSRLRASDDRGQAAGDDFGGAHHAGDDHRGAHHAGDDHRGAHHAGDDHRGRGAHHAGDGGLHGEDHGGRRGDRKGGRRRGKDDHHKGGDRDDRVDEDRDDDHDEGSDER